MKRQRPFSFLDGENGEAEEALQPFRKNAKVKCSMHVWLHPTEMFRLIYLYRTIGMVPSIDWKTHSNDGAEMMAITKGRSLVLDSIANKGGVYQLYDDGLAACLAQDIPKGQELLDGIAQFSVFETLLPGFLPKMGRPLQYEWVDIDPDTKKRVMVGNVESSLYRGLIQPLLGEPRLLLMIVSFLGEDP